ncbi:hypothetical protein L2E82_30855 [Cichorium intybus]|uniref:Uncharacterized protein n=1 Tax=Cichorium intybus TaxID=13427 RepID=A0ACB9D203_CICIN|nr:hypothetical protein L2E82_30855 [Cichorium intybus]
MVHRQMCTFRKRDPNRVNDANISKFPRGSKPSDQGKKAATVHKTNATVSSGRFEPLSSMAVIGNGGSYAVVVSGGKANNMAVVKGNVHDEPALILDETCPNDKDVSLTLVGKVKEFGALLNLKDVIVNEGFKDVLLRYLGGFWVTMEFVSTKAKEKFQRHKGVGSWFAVILPWTKTFQVEDRVVWIDIEGVPSLAYSPRSVELIAKRWGELLYAEDSNDNNLYRKRLCIKTLNQEIIMETFKVIVEGKVTVVRAREVIG